MNKSEELLPCREAFEKWHMETYDRDPYIHYPPEWEMSKKYTTDAQMEFDVWQAAWNTRPSEPCAGEVAPTVANSAMVQEDAREAVEGIVRAVEHAEAECGKEWLENNKNYPLKQYPHGLTYGSAKTLIRAAQNQPERVTVEKFADDLQTSWKDTDECIQNAKWFKNKYPHGLVIVEGEK